MKEISLQAKNYLMAYEWLLLVEILLIWGIISIATQSGFFVPLPMPTIRKILNIAKIRKNDVVYDLGSGDGRIVITAAKEYGVKAVGIEKNPMLHWLSKWNVKRHNVSSKVKLIRGDFFKQNLSKASVVVVYLTPRLNARLKPKLEKELKKGTIVVSASHVFEGWRETSKIKTGHFHSYLYKV